jgi:hypothetical protein
VLTADGAAGAGRKTDEAAARPALDAARQVREIAREPQQLQLEREGERVERRPRRREHGRRVEKLEEPVEGVERTLVRLRLAEQPKHRLGSYQSDGEPVRLLAHAPVRPYEVHPRHRVQLARSFVEHELHVRERLEPAAEARLRLSRTLRNRPDAATGRRVQVKDAIGLGEP